MVALLMSPWAIGFTVFFLYPMAASLYYSFTHYDILATPRWAGLENYRFMLSRDPDFWLSIRNTLWILFVGTPIRILFAVLTAMLLTRPRRGVKVYRTIFFLPSMVPPVAAAIGFVFLLNPNGPINQSLHLFGWHNPPLWFYQPNWSKWGLILLGMWGVGEAMIIFLAGLLDVPRQLYEAADIEGASGRQKFWHVTLPMISPVIFFSLVIGVIDSFQYFTQAYVAGTTVASSATGIGQPQGSLLFYSLNLYQQGFRYFHMGYASALAWVLFVITMACTILLIRTSTRWVHYQGGMLR